MARRVVACGVGALWAALAGFGAPCAASATEYSSPFTLAKGVQLPDGGSHIELTSIVIVRFVPTPDINDPASSDIIAAECVKFVNHDARTAKRVLVRLSYRGADAKEAGSDPLDMRGAFSLGASIGIVRTPSGPFSSLGQTCREASGFGWGGDGVRHVSYGRRQIVTLAASVCEVDYADGTAWRESDPAVSPMCQSIAH